MIVEWSLRIQPFLLGTSATQRRQKCHSKDVINVYRINPVVMGFQMKICLILFFLVDYGNVFCPSANELQ